MAELEWHEQRASRAGRQPEVRRLPRGHDQPV